MKYKVTSFGADVVINKRVINLLTGEYVDMYSPIDYFATQDKFNEYVDFLIEARDKMKCAEIPECWKYED